jgi:hypothetical protein
LSVCVCVCVCVCAKQPSHSRTRPRKPPTHPPTHPPARRKDIAGQFVKAYGFTFHVHCMSCAVCKKPITNDGFYDDITDKILHLECLKSL